MPTSEVVRPGQIAAVESIGELSNCLDCSILRLHAEILVHHIERVVGEAAVDQGGQRLKKFGSRIGKHHCGTLTVSLMPARSR